MVSPVIIRPVLAILVTAASIGIVAFIFQSGSHDRAPEQTALRKLPQNIDIALKKARFSEIREGSIVWELVAERVEYDKSGEVAHLGDIRMDFVRSRMAGAITVTAEQGDYSIDKRDVKLRGKVHVETEDGVSFDTESIEYKALKTQFKTMDQITFRQQRLTLTAVGMEMDVKNQRVRFFKQIDAMVAGAKLSGVSAGAGSRSVPGSENKADKRRKGNGR